MQTRRFKTARTHTHTRIHAHTHTHPHTRIAIQVEGSTVGVVDWEVVADVVGVVVVFAVKCDSDIFDRAQCPIHTQHNECAQSKQGNRGMGMVRGKITKITDT